MIVWCWATRACPLVTPSRLHLRVRQWYAHQGTTVWCVTGGTDRAVGLGYHEKGWPSFEYRLAMMIKVSNDSGLSDWPQVVDLGKEGDAQWKGLARQAPAEPLAFFGGHEYGEKKYTNGADRDAIVAPKCAPRLSFSPCDVRGWRTPRRRPPSALAGFGRRPSSCWAA